MKILLIGGNGTIGKKVAAGLSLQHELIFAARTTGDIQVDITSATSIEEMFRASGIIDACVCTAGTGYYGPFDTMTANDMLPGIEGKLMGQINLVLIGKSYLAEGGSFTLTSGIAANHPARHGSCVATINGAINSFVLAASQELRQDRRINVVSPGLVEDSAERYGHLFPGYNLVPMVKVVNAYKLSIEGAINGKILKVFS
ncbi:short chain dehydrogenase [Pedobacter yulinensis]|uniref:Short chain dehydrogenase n=1 Tax=Pedobacter yulinensis TaxID=2126353 RepID=A0A2T3HMJ6_9SPHI|nr:short chain dehydrogenase [Pedobacter yulinensis]PST83657.1 short chain dehydrogenase [Pedobacter yulinensis]